MFADRNHNVQAQGVLSRSGPALAVIGIHVLLIYAIAASMGVVPIPSVIKPSEVVLIPEEPIEPDPIKPIEPELKIPTPTEAVKIELPVVPPVEVDVAPAETSPPIQVAEAVAPPAPTSQMQDLKATQRVEPTYPAQSRRANEEGAVRLRVLVDAKGRPSDIQLAQGSGFSRLDNAAIEAVRRWRFQAANNGSGAVSAWTQVSITFKLTDQK